ncbi:Uncharacterised protein [Vibrio cholerae]|nr:Uncharacterised protein [Vibrio cholerae]
MIQIDESDSWFDVLGYPYLRTLQQARQQCGRYS